ncbi:glutamate-1-semialdehyde 2,1-aminomutase [Ramlibacter sp. AN1015]|uniref:glutamate-1-semialdehyde 2,1-aminomutase n=1 Tax=Ramlibacter sp. AN1015 TaxID=3133428 RepID=UPI0030BBE30F
MRNLPHGNDRFHLSKAMMSRLQRIVPGGSHTYAKGDDQFPERAPGLLARGHGCRVWDADGNEFIEYGMGLRSVTLGHAEPRVIEAVAAALPLGTNFTRPSIKELECAEAFLDIVPGAEMVKFTKDGSTAVSAAVKLARKHTGRTLVAIAAEHPFFSYDDWFIRTTSMHGGIPEQQETLTFRYNALDSVRALFQAHPGKIAAVVLEAARTDEPAAGFLQGLQAICRQEGAVLIFDEMITGFRWNLGGAQAEYGVTPDLSTFGKALANGFSVSALCGSRELMRLGSRERPCDDVFLLSTTHGAETTGLAAALATMRIYRTEPVVEHLHRQGKRLAEGVGNVARRRGVDGHFKVLGRSCNLLYATTGPDGQPSQALRTLFMQELIARGVIAPSFVVSYAHTDADIDRTIEAVDGALEIYARALEDGAERHLIGAPSRVVFGRR